MKNLTSCLILSLLLLGCAQMEQEDLSGSGEVRFKAVSVNSFSGNMPHGRTEAASDWKHIFREQARLEVVNKNTGQVYGVDYNPNEFGEGFTLSLPYGSYTYTSEVEGGKFRRYLPFRIEGEFILNVVSLDLTLNATTDYGLITVKNEFVRSLKIGHGTDFFDKGLLEDGSHYFIYVRNGLDPLLEINSTFENQLITRQVAVQAYNHYHFFLRLPQNSGSDNFIELALGAFEYTEEGIEINGQAETGTFTDPRDGQVYRTVRIGEQVWMAENLNYASDNSWCYDDDPANCAKYGRLYTRNTALSVCPDGWHLPSWEEWDILGNYLGGRSIAGNKMKAIGWEPPNSGSTNESGFSALPGGIASLEGGEIKRFFKEGIEGLWWGSDLTRDPNLGGGLRYYFTFLIYNYTDLFNGGRQVENTEEEIAISCRCLKN